MQEKLAGSSVGLLLLMIGLTLIIWPHKIQSWNVKNIEKENVSPHDLFLQGWKHPSNIWTLRAMGVGATFMACGILGKIFFGFNFSW